MPTLRTTPNETAAARGLDGSWLRFLPAWLGSLVVHALLLLLIGLAWSAQAPVRTRLASFAQTYIGCAPSDEVFESTPKSLTDAATTGGDTSPFGDPSGVDANSLSTADALRGAQFPLDRADILSIAPAKPAANPSATRSVPLRGADIAAGLREGEKEGEGTGRPRVAFSKGRTSFYGIEAEGSKFVYVFDRSGSMEGPPLRSAKEELIASIQLLDDINQFQIIFYNHDVRIFDLAGDPRRLVFGTTENKARADRFIHAMMADGGTAHEPALCAAFAMRPDVIYFLTDADQPALTRAQLDALHKMNAGATIHTIEFGIEERTVHDNFLFQLAHENGGAYKYVNVHAAFKN